MLKSAPVTAAALIVTGPVPVELRVITCVAGVFSDTLPKATLATLMLRVGTGTSNCTVKLCVTDPAFALRVAFWAVLTGVTLAVNCTLVVLACTSAALDTGTAALSLDRPTLNPAAGAGALIIAVHNSAPVPVIVALLQLKPVSAGGVCAAAPVPVRLTTVALVEALVVIATCPVASPTTSGPKLTLKL
jgi:hypothetical protein